MPTSSESDQTQLKPPADNEVEVSLFGPGVGECVVVHGGGGRWLVVDSCRETSASPPVALAYLSEIGVDPDQVRLLVATHWDDDHIGGMAELHRALTSAAFWCSAALNNRDVPAFLLEQAQSLIRQGSGVDELRTIFVERTNSKSGSPGWAMWNVDLLGDNTPFPLDVWGLSPSPEAVGRGFFALVHRAHGLEPARKVIDFGPNEGSVAMWIRAGDARVLLGADLEEPGPANRGWSAILGGNPKRWLENGKAGLFKVAHHGSADARHDRVWTDLLEPEPVAILAPYRRGANPPPTDENRAWIHARTPNAHTTVRDPTTRRRRRRSEVERHLRATGKRLIIPRGFGHVRARTAADSASWTVEYFGGAGELPP